ncbi:hypothetical protein Droror1_Dr00025121 [Drosera rotundifolia]
MLVNASLDRYCSSSSLSSAAAHTGTAPSLPVSLVGHHRTPSSPLLPPDLPSSSPTSPDDIHRRLAGQRGTAPPRGSWELCTPRRGEGTGRKLHAPGSGAMAEGERAYPGEEKPRQTSQQEAQQNRAPFFSRRPGTTSFPFRPGIKASP